MNLIIFVHELFHLLAARILKIEATEFAIGMGPSLFAFQKQAGRRVFKFLSKKGDGAISSEHMSYHIRLIPLGGYVSFGKEKNGITEDGLNIHKPWKRIIVAAAGPFGNLVFAVFLVMILLLSNSHQGPGLKIVSVVPDSLAEAVGMKENDTLLKVNGENVQDPNDLKKELVGGSSICFDIKRNEQHINVCGMLDDVKEPAVGIQYREGVSWTELLPKSIEMIYLLSSEYIKHFVDTIYGLEVDKLSGPVGIVDTMQQSVDEFKQFLEILILVNIALGIANLLFPFSITDGGRIVIDLFAILFRKDRLSTKYLDFASVALMVLMLLTTTFLDISRIFK